MPPTYTYFKPEEIEGLVPEFVAKLDQARHTAGTSFIITSGFRTPEKNSSVIGAVPNSAHLKGLAVDLMVVDSHQTWQIVSGLLSVGITRIGVYVDKWNQPTHIHCDDDPEKPPEVLFIKQEAFA